MGQLCPGVHQTPAGQKRRSYPLAFGVGAASHRVLCAALGLTIPEACEGHLNVSRGGQVSW